MNDRYGMMNMARKANKPRRQKPAPERSDPPATEPAEPLGKALVQFRRSGEGRNSFVSSSVAWGYEPSSSSPVAKRPRWSCRGASFSAVLDQRGETGPLSETASISGDRNTPCAIRPARAHYSRNSLRIKQVTAMLIIMEAS